MLSLVIVMILFLVVLSQAYSFMSPRSMRSPRTTQLHMGGNKAKFGIFSPVVYGAKFVLGEAKLNKVSSMIS